MDRESLFETIRELRAENRQLRYQIEQLKHPRSESEDERQDYREHLAEMRRYEAKVRELESRENLTTYEIQKLTDYRRQLASLRNYLRGFEGSVINSCVACFVNPKENPGSSFCGQECRRTFLLSKMKI
jgi:regulator of replication initiation timing